MSTSAAKNESLMKSMFKPRNRDYSGGEADAPNPVIVHHDPRKITDIDVALIDESPYQARTVPQSHIDALAESFRDSWINTPVLIRPKPNGRFELVAGHSRFKGWVQAGHPTIPSLIRQMTDKEALIALISDNAIRKDLTDYEHYKETKNLQSAGVLSVAEMSKIFGKGRADIYRYLSFGNLPVDVLEHLEKRQALADPEIISGSTAEVLSALGKLAPENVSEGFFKLVEGKFENQSQLASWARNRIAVLTEGAKPKEKSSEPLTGVNGKRIGTIRVADGKLAINSKQLDMEKVAALLRRELPNLMK